MENGEEKERKKKEEKSKKKKKITMGKEHFPRAGSTLLAV
jgi:hypothetical protein